MATRAEVLQAIKNADAAGDSAAVLKLGAYYKTLPAEVQSSAGVPPSTQPQPAQPETRESLAAGIRSRGDEVDKAVGRGLMAPFVGGAQRLEEANNWIARKLGMEEAHGVRNWSQRRDAEWQADPASKARSAGGLEALGTIASPPNLLLMRAGGPSGPGALASAGRIGTNALAGATGGAMVPTSNEGERDSNVLWGAGLGGALPAIASGVGRLFRGSPRSAPVQAAVSDAQKAGYVLPPTELNPSPVNAFIEGVSGKVKTSQAASARNQGVTNALASRALGLPESTPLTKEATEGVRKAAGSAYENVRNSGQIFADDAFANELQKIGARTSNAAQSFPELAGQNPINDVLAGLNKPEFNASHGIDMIGILRDRASKAYTSGDKELGKAYRGASEALEGLIERNLYANGEPNALKAFQEARKRIAMTYTVDKAMNPATGDVSAAVIARDYARGKPLSGELETIGRVGSSFPKATQALPQNYNAFSLADIGMGGVASFHNPFLASLALARPGVRAGALSAPGQALLGMQPGATAAEIGGLVTPASRMLVPAQNPFTQNR